MCFSKRYSSFITYFWEFFFNFVSDKAMMKGGISLNHYLPSWLFHAQHVFWSGNFIGIKPMKTYYNSISNVPRQTYWLFRQLLWSGDLSIWDMVIYKYNEKKVLCGYFEAVISSMQNLWKRTTIHSNLLLFLKEKSKPSLFFHFFDQKVVFLHL